MFGIFLAICLGLGVMWMLSGGGPHDPNNQHGLPVG